MKDQSSESVPGNENVVSFPLSGNSNVISKDLDHQDPLDLLLNEFSDLVDQMEPDFKEAPARDYELTKQLELSPRERLAYKLGKLTEVSQRLKYYMDDIETFMPRLKK